MQTTLALIILSLISCFYAQQLLAGVAKVDTTMPVGVPLAGYSDRRVSSWPIPQYTKYTALLRPSEGVDHPLYAKCLALESNGVRTIIITTDSIGSSGTVSRLAFEEAQRLGLKTPFSNILFAASHTHAGPGAVDPSLLWQWAPSTDFLHREVQTMFANKMAECLLEAEKRLQPAKIGITVQPVYNATVNRRAGISPYVRKDTVDPSMGIIRIDDLQGRPIATVWNYAVHGTCYGGKHMNQNSDVMGLANMIMEEQIGGVALFLNGALGDIAPAECNPKPMMPTSIKFAEEVKKIRERIQTFSHGIDLRATSYIENFGYTQMNLTLERLGECKQPKEWWKDFLCYLCREMINCSANVQLGSAWIENTPRFTAISLSFNGKHTVLTSIPGEAIYELGQMLKSETRKLGYDHTFVVGCANNHLGYFTSPREYLVGGYESLLTFWGVETGLKIVRGSATPAAKIAPRK